MRDPIVLAAAIGLVVSPAAGIGLVRALATIPERWHRALEWLLVVAIVAIAIAAQLASDGRAKEVTFVVLLGALPGIVAYVAWRTALASAVVSLVPLYFGLGAMTLGRPLHRPAIAIDRLVPLQPAWMLVYASMYVFVLLPLLVARERTLFRRALQSYVFVLVGAYVGFVFYPTVGPRPAAVAGGGFAAWSLRLQYAMDWQYNCFPSLHVAHSFVSALTAYRVHRGVGVAATLWAALIGVSTMFTKQHYAVDVIAGAMMACVAYLIFLRPHPRELVPERDRRLAPVRALRVVGVFAAFVALAWMLYAGGVDASAQTSQPGSTATFATIQRLETDLLSTRSATATLEAWCRDHRLADPARVVAHVAAGASKAPERVQLERLHVVSAREVKYRLVRLQCGTHVLSEADNWYVPSRLTPDMNRLLDTTDTPFGKAVAPLEPHRETIAVRLRWTDSTQPAPDVLFEHRAVLYTRGDEPFSEVDERYRRELIEGTIRP